MQILEELESQRDAIDAALRFLKGGATPGIRRRGKSKPAASVRRPRLSAAARKKISAAAKRRWAIAKKAGRTSLRAR